MPFKSQVDRQIQEKGGAVNLTAPPMMFVRIWQFRVPSEKAEEST